MFREIFMLRVLAAFAVALMVAALSIPAFAHEGREVGDLNFVVGFLNEPAIEGQPNAASVRITSHDDEMDHGAAEMGHGELFTSDAITADESFEFTFDSTLVGQTISYHVHPVEVEGIITISSEASTSGSAVIEVTASGANPAMLTVAPGTTVMFHNMTGADMAVLSGTLASMNMPGDAGMTDETASLQIEIRHPASGSTMTTNLEERFNDQGHYVSHFIPTAPGTYEFRVFGTVHGEDIDETFTGGPTTFSDVTAASEVQFPVQLAAAREVENAARGAQDSANQAIQDADSASSTATLALAFGIVGTVVGIAGVSVGAWGLQAARKR